MECATAMGLGGILLVNFRVGFGIGFGDIVVELTIGNLKE